MELRSGTTITTTHLFLVNATNRSNQSIHIRNSTSHVRMMSHKVLVDLNVEINLVRIEGREVVRCIGLTMLLVGIRGGGDHGTGTEVT
jgi:hypothetical protein